MASLGGILETLIPQRRKLRLDGSTQKRESKDIAATEASCKGKASQICESDFPSPTHSSVPQGS